MDRFSHDLNKFSKLKVVLLGLILAMVPFLVLLNTGINTSAVNFGYNTDLQYANYRFVGENSNDEAGRSVSLSPDINGDGIGDILIGSGPYDVSGKPDIGKTYVVFGSRESLEPYSNLANAQVSFLGEKRYDRAGTIISAGDVNGDGLGDILIGAPYNDLGGGQPFISNDGAGQVYLILGRASGLEPDMPLSSADASFVGEDAYDNVGYDICSAGDFNGDGFDDILISSQYRDQDRVNAGKVYLILGKNTGWKLNFNLAMADFSFIGEKDDDRLHEVSSAGDVNGDGLDDILLGAPRNDDGGSDAGKAYLIFGKRSSDNWGINATVNTGTDVYFTGERSNDKLSKVSGVKDVNKDGFDDFLLGSPQNNDGGLNAGKVYMFLGHRNTWQTELDLADADATFVGENADDYSANIASAGDINGDGFYDFIISSKLNDKGGENSGQVYLFLGNGDSWDSGTDLQKADASFVSNQDHGNAGSLLGHYEPGDINGDGFDDLLIGEPGFSAVESKIGQSYLFFLEINTRPNSIDRINTYTNPSYTQTLEKVNIFEKVYIEIEGEDSDQYRRNLAEVRISSKYYDPNGIVIPLLETDNNSGIFRGPVLVTNITHETHKWIGVKPTDELSIQSIENPGLIKTLVVGPRLRIEDISLINGDGPDGKTIYNGLKPYTIKVTATSTLGSDDFDRVEIGWMIDTLGLPIRMVWYQNNDTFEILDSPEGWLNFAEPKSVRITENNCYEIYFNLNFNWLYPEYATSIITIYSTSKTMGPQWTNISNPGSSIFFNTINSVILEGSPTVHGSIQGSISDGAVVLVGETLTWSGLKAVYYDPANSEDVFTASGSLRARIKDSFGNIWLADIISGENVTFEVIVPEQDNGMITYFFELIEIPEENDLTELTFNLNITGTRPPPPMNFQVHADGFNDINVNADNDGELYLRWEKPSDHLWEIEGYFFSTTNNEFTTDGAWTEDTRGIITLAGELSELEDGAVDIYVWSKDIYGSIGPSTVETIMIDTNSVRFENATPEPKSVLINTKVDLSVLISDKGGSGVNGSSISYRKSTTGLDGYGPWISFGETIDGTMIFCSFASIFEPGNDNYLQWRAKDRAGNGYTNSEDYNIIIDTQLSNIPPTVSLLSPENGSVVTSEMPTLYWKGTDRDGDSIYYDVYFSDDYKKVMRLDNSVLVASDLPSTQFEASMPLENDGTYYWTIIPNDKTYVGTCLMDVWSFHIDLSLSSSIVTLLLPNDNFIISSLKPTLMWKVEYEGLNPVTISYDIYLDTNPNPRKIVSASQLENSYSPFYPLKNGLNYYWKVIPYADDVKGTCISGVWQFKIDLNFSYEISIQTEYSKITIERDDYRNVELYITNKGNQPDTIQLLMTSDDLDDTTINTSMVILPRYDRGLATLSIHVHREMPVGTYYITVRAVSEGAKIQGQLISDEVEITVVIIESSEDSETDRMISIITTLSIVIIILNIVLFFIFINDRRNRREKEHFKSMYFIQKYSRTGSGVTDSKGRQFQPGSRPPGKLKIAEPAETVKLQHMMNQLKQNKKELNYTMEDKLAILKYLRNNNKISDSQYRQGLLNIRKKLESKSKEHRHRHESFKSSKSPMENNNKSNT